MTALLSRSTGFMRSVVATASANVAVTVIAGTAGVLVTRSLGADGRGHYAAAQAWFEVAVVIGALGQTAATTFFVARDPRRAADHVATSRTIMLLSALVVVAGAAAVLPYVAAGPLTRSWNFGFLLAMVAVSLVGSAYLFALMGTHLRHWNIARLSQPVLFLCAIMVLQITGRISLEAVLAALMVSLALQALLAYGLCWQGQLTKGITDLTLARPMARYGLSHLASSAPTLASTRLDQLVLSVAVAPAALGHYAVAISLTTLAFPVVAAAGYVAFPRLASRQVGTADASKMQRSAILFGAAICVVTGCLLAASAYWVVPGVFGPEFHDAVPLVWMLAPAGVLLGCGQICGDLLRGHGRPQDVAVAQIAAACLAVALLVTLVPVLGVYGAAIASTAGPGLALLLLLRALGRQGTVPVAEPEAQLVTPGAQV